MHIPAQIIQGGDGVDQFLTKKPNIYYGKNRKASSTNHAGLTGCLHAEEYR